jgi:hypothetical protein
MIPPTKGQVQIGVALTCLIICVLWVEFERHTGKKTCASYSSYAEILKAFPTNPQLDGNHDGMPCESRF